MKALIYGQPLIGKQLHPVAPLPLEGEDSCERRHDLDIVFFMLYGPATRNDPLPQITPKEESL